MYRRASARVSTSPAAGGGDAVFVGGGDVTAAVALGAPKDGPKDGDEDVDVAAVPVLGAGVEEVVAAAPPHATNKTNGSPRAIRIASSVAC